ncbi:flagellar M-ring protein FliF [Bacillus sp. BRMEA1]|uniref:flagellar basal-body MS-ring/collar protein FliF n=1 Tax=Neobacillus endophyticus TaxID=2738405 RepID=UPI00156571D5|nr:flagellar basal-body MS-ring/collar protein FliF [Neobacillus endophyticus]NRD79407.1 flagellar M-ring protein FliF [Neobacillus endophyticus]
MNRSWTDQIKQTGERFGNYWKARSSKQKWIFIGTFLFLFLTLSVFIYFASRPQYVPLYSGDLTTKDVGDIKAELDKEGYSSYQLSQNGTMIMVPQKDAANLVVTLASKGYPQNNTINYDVFSNNLSFGATDRQYNILERQAMQNQIADVLKRVDGIKNASVILTLPDNSVFVTQDNQQKASASVMVEVAPGTQLDSGQIRALYTLVSKSVPNLPMSNISIMNQYSEELTTDSSSDGSDGSDQSAYTQQQKIQQQEQNEIQQNLQSLLSTVLGTNKVYVQTFVKMNFDKVKTEEKLVQPVDKNNNGIVISSDKSAISSKGAGSSAGGVVGTGSTDVPGYTGTSSGGNNTYDETHDIVNYEVNHINNQIVKSPYQIDDITINVGVQPDAKNNKLSKATDAAIRNIISNTVRTALGHPNMTQSDIDQRITIFPHTFADNQLSATSGQQNNWLMIGGAIATGLLLIGGVIWLIARKRKKDELDEEIEPLLSFKKPAEEADYFAEQEITVEKQLKKLLDQRPEDFSKVIRTWLNDEEV